MLGFKMSLRAALNMQFDMPALEVGKNCALIYDKNKESSLKMSVPFVDVGARSMKE